MSKKKEQPREKIVDVRDVRGKRSRLNDNMIMIDRYKYSVIFVQSHETY